MPEAPTTFLSRITLTMTEDLSNAIQEAAVSKRMSPEALMIEYVRLGLGMMPSPRLPPETLRDILAAEMKLYAVEAINGTAFLTHSADRSVFAIIDVGQFQQKRFANAGLIVRLVNDFIVIEHDQNDKPLADALIQAGIPRSQIVLAYAGEPIPESA